MLFALSAGHHPKAKGAQYNGFNEHDEAVLWVDELAMQLGSDALIVPTGLLREKVAFINSHNCDAAIEVHFNSAIIDGKPVGRGCETLYYPKSSKGKHLAQIIQRSIAPMYFPNRGIKEGWYRMDVPGRVDYHGDVEGDEKPDYFLAKTKCPAVIIEPDFVHNSGAIRKHRKAACEAIANALKGWRYGG